MKILCTILAFIMVANPTLVLAYSFRGAFASPVDYLTPEQKDILDKLSLDGTTVVVADGLRVVGDSDLQGDIDGGGNIAAIGNVSGVDGSFTGDVAGASLSDGVLTIASGAISSATDIGCDSLTATGAVQGLSLTDGVLTATLGAISAATNIGCDTVTATGAIEGLSLTDGVATLTTGELTGLTLASAAEVQVTTLAASDGTPALTLTGGTGNVTMLANATIDGNLGVGATNPTTHVGTAYLSPDWAQSTAAQRVQGLWIESGGGALDAFIHLDAATRRWRGDGILLTDRMILYSSLGHAFKFFNGGGIEFTGRASPPDALTGAGNAGNVLIYKLDGDDNLYARYDDAPSGKGGRIDTIARIEDGVLSAPAAEFTTLAASDGTPALTLADGTGALTAAGSLRAEAIGLGIAPPDGVEGRLKIGMDWGTDSSDIRRAIEVETLDGSLSGDNKWVIGGPNSKNRLSASGILRMRGGGATVDAGSVNVATSLTMNPISGAPSAPEPAGQARIYKLEGDDDLYIRYDDAEGGKGGRIDTIARIEDGVLSAPSAAFTTVGVSYIDFAEAPDPALVPADRLYMYQSEDTNLITVENSDGTTVAIEFP